ncbi:hypothetical protein N3K66_008141 [Trichothecium roseum]|uniref:Uncharacterized protein n=1 Tax=Trichothecium roseum TaxID=47278 RepID=A0ACC0UUE0_9HYPO|nr:hypothetical protein N3K66_008141 [Trichothecium roseum]
MDHQENIDDLLVKYLNLLDQYTSLRGQLSSLQTDVFHNIARANFSAERGRRYGQDHYDERMQAIRTLELVHQEGGDLPSISVKNTALQTKESEGDVPRTTEHGGRKEDSQNDNEAENATEDKSETAQDRKKDPIRWFGILTPQSLRTAQVASIESVEQVIPRLVAVNAEMRNLEIEVRRARKRRAKADVTKVDGTAPDHTPVAA